MRSRAGQSLLACCLAGVIGSACSGRIEGAGRGPNGSASDDADGDPTAPRGPSSDAPGGAGDDEPGGDGSDPALDPVASDPAVMEACAELDVGITPLRRLTRSQYNESVFDLLGDTSRPADEFAPDEKLLGFDAGMTVSPLLVQQYMNTAEALATAATANLPALLGCDPATDGEDACAHAFIDRFGRKIYRRPLEADEQTELRALYSAAKTDFDFRTGIELVLQAFLQSPAFLYRVELGAPSSVPEIVQLTGYEVASRLSYFLWGSTPDAMLLDAAETGELDTEAGIEQHARRLLADDRARATVRSFHEQWLAFDVLERTGKDPNVYPEFTDELRGAMRDETLRFVEHAIFEDDGSVSTLLTSGFSFVNAELAGIYGLSGTFGSELERTELDATQRKGLLTQASVLTIHAKANQSSPVHRGKFVREHLLCQQLSPPPANLVIVPPDPDPSASTRERFAEHSTNDACTGCHNLMDPIGFGFEHYDGIGRYRDMDGTFTVDSRGEVMASRDADGPFDGALELADRLAQSQEVRECVASEWFVYAFGRSVNNELDRCSRETVFRAFEAADYSIPELLVALTATNAFRYARTTMPEAQP